MKKMRVMERWSSLFENRETWIVISIQWDHGVLKRHSSLVIGSRC